MSARRTPDGSPPRSYGVHRRSGRRDTYVWWEYAIIAVVVVVILGGAALLIRVVLTSGDPEPGATPRPTPSAVTCPASEWQDPVTGECQPRPTCGPGEDYDDASNTCRLPAPDLTGITPTSGPPEGGTKITISGTGFQDGAVVTINGVPGVDTRVVNTATITTRTPESRVYYPVDVEVTNPDGQADLLDNVWTYLAPPVENITEIIPDEGAASGGEAVVIKGVDFVDGAEVSFYGRPATDVVVLNSTTIRATIPAGPVGPVSVNVRNPGEDASTLLDGFTYVDRPPRVVMIVRPGEGPLAGGTKVTIAGTGFEDGAEVSIGGTPARKVVVVDSTKITAVTPAGDDGPADVAVRNPGVPAAILAEGFTYVETAVIDTLDPVDGSELGGTKVTITGELFEDGATVSFDGVPATDVKVVSSTRITAVTPPGTVGAVDVEVANPDQPAGVARKGFTYITAAEAEARLPRCRPFTLPRVSAPPGGSVILTAGDLFSSQGIEGGRLVDAVLVTRAPAAESGSITWRPEPPRIAWSAAAASGARGAILASYEADSCRGTAEGLTIPVLTE